MGQKHTLMGRVHLFLKDSCIAKFCEGLTNPNVPYYKVDDHPYHRKTMGVETPAQMRSASFYLIHLETLPRGAGSNCTFFFCLGKRAVCKVSTHLQWIHFLLS